MERYRKCVYCETQFLREILSRLSDKAFSFESLSEYELWMNVRSLLLSSDIKLYLNMSKNEFDYTIKDIERRRLNAAKKGKELQFTHYEELIFGISIKQITNEIHLKLQDDFPDFKVVSDKELNAFYFTCKKQDECKKLMSDYGILVVSPETIMDFRFVLFDQGVAIKKLEQGNWEEILKEIAMPCNSMIIVDNYILNELEQAKDNLKGIFDALLPLSLNSETPFHISIFTALKQNKNVDLPSKARLDEIMKLLGCIRPNLNVELSIIKCPSDKFHDRTIITNNYYIGCGGGFDLFKSRKSQKTTTVNIISPYLNHSIKWAIKAYSDLISESSKVFVNTPEFLGDSFPNFYVGVKKNRILESIMS